MINPATRSLFAVLKNLIPGVPEHCTRFQLLLSMDAPPQVQCDFIIKDAEANSIEEDHKRYSLSEIEP